MPAHPLWNWITATVGIPEVDLRFFSDHPCPPDVLGLNYYVKSERWLDEDLNKYPCSTHGGNQRHQYADTEVVRACPTQRMGLGFLGREAWFRYRISLAITEVHLHCTREEQMRWWNEIWQAARGLSQDGVPVEGVTAWSLLGAADWDSLLTRADQHYEPGAFVPDGESIRLTALGRVIKATKSPRSAPHPLLLQKDWWHGRQRLSAVSPPHSLLIVGEAGLIGQALTRGCTSRGIPYQHHPSTRHLGEENFVVDPVAF